MILAWSDLPGSWLVNQLVEIDSSSKAAVRQQPALESISLDVRQHQADDTRQLAQHPYGMLHTNATVSRCGTDETSDAHSTYRYRLDGFLIL